MSFSIFHVTQIEESRQLWTHPSKSRSMHLTDEMTPMTNVLYSSSTSYTLKLKTIQLVSLSTFQVAKFCNDPNNKKPHQSRYLVYVTQRPKTQTGEHKQYPQTEPQQNNLNKLPQLKKFRIYKELGNFSVSCMRLMCSKKCFFKTPFCVHYSRVRRIHIQQFKIMQVFSEQFQNHKISQWRQVSSNSINVEAQRLLTMSSSNLPKLVRV